MQEIGKVLTAFCQISASLLASFPGIEWPAEFKRWAEMFDVLNFDFVNFDFLQAHIQGTTDYCGTTLSVMAAFTLLLAAIPAGWLCSCAVRTSKRRRAEFKNRCA